MNIRLNAVLLLMTACALLATGFVEASPLKRQTTADHRKFKELNGPFASGPAVTQACLSCHTEAAGQVQRTKHWTWEFLNPGSGQRLGKKNVINNFCISINSNYPFCTSCHVGYGWRDNSFDFSDESKVDCLVCHDTTGLYVKQPGFAGEPLTADTEYPPGSGRMLKGVDLATVAQRVGKSSRDTCGACHFRGGGGDGVKHGDMDSSLAAPDEAVDVHMDALGLDFTCGDCHLTSAHEIPGSRYALQARDKGGYHMRGREGDGNPASCIACHDNTPHKEAAAAPRLNQHVRKIACQTCHIPAMARGGVPTKLSWDWSTAGKLDAEGKQFTIKDDHGHAIYASHKGDFTLGENVVPEYRWFNGKVQYTLLDDRIDPAQQPVFINRIEGSPDDGESLIWPLKIMRGKQPYDKDNMTLVTPHTAGDDASGYWKNLDWESAIAVGMRSSGAPFSGAVGFVETQMFWPLTHMVAPKENALACGDCHQKQGRLAGVSGVYLPGRDSIALLDRGGWLLALLTFVGVVGHGGMRVIASMRRKGN